MSELRSSVLERTYASLIDVPVMSNVVRGDFAECLVAIALGDKWSMTTTWESWDLKHQDGWKLEVKQSAQLQVWHIPGDPRIERAKLRFDIAKRKSYWRGERRVAQQGRIADLYVFAAHTDITDLADQREPSQWRFYVVPEARLPNQKSIALSRLKQMTGEVPIEGLEAQVKTALEELGSPKPV